MRGRLSAAVIVASAAACPAAAGVEVRFVAPAGYSDVESFASGRSREAVLAEFERHLTGLAARLLPAGQDLRLDILDVDLAGESGIGRGSNFGVRIVSDRTPPRIRLRWNISQGRRALGGGEETLTDPFFQWHPARGIASDPLVAEKELLTTWFRWHFDPGALRPE